MGTNFIINYNMPGFESVSIDDKSSVRRKLFSKKLERMADVINILEEIKMIFLDIKNNVHCRIK